MQRGLTARGGPLTVSRRLRPGATGSSASLEGCYGATCAHRARRSLLAPVGVLGWEWRWRTRASGTSACTCSKTVAPVCLLAHLGTCRSANERGCRAARRGGAAWRKPVRSAQCAAGPATHESRGGYAHAHGIVLEVHARLVHDARPHREEAQRCGRRRAERPGRGVAALAERLGCRRAHACTAFSPTHAHTRASHTARRQAMPMSGVAQAFGPPLRARGMPWNLRL